MRKNSLSLGTGKNNVLGVPGVMSSYICEEWGSHGDGQGQECWDPIGENFFAELSVHSQGL